MPGARRRPSRAALRTRLTYLAAAAAVTLCALRAGECVSEYHVPRRSADLVVVLGGGVDERIAVAADISRRDGTPILWYFGPPGLTATRAGRASLAYYRNLFALRGADTTRIIHAPATSSTWSEAVAVRQYARDHAIRSITIVTDPPNALRVRRMYTWAFAGEPCAWEIATSRPAWWDDRRWWKDGRSARAALSELVKISYYALRHAADPGVR